MKPALKATHRGRVAAVCRPLS